MQKTFWDFFKFLTISITLVVLFRTFIAQPFIVSGASMEPTFENGDYLIVDELSYNLSDPKVGDVIIFRPPMDQSKFYIKRIVGLPGDIIDVNGQKTTLKDNEYFVIGDNRDNSSDSRKWGPLPEDLIVGRALLRLWPLNQISILPGDN